MTKWIFRSEIPLYYPDGRLPSYSEDELKTLVNRYLVDPSYRNDVVESQMRLTLTIASVYLSKYRFDQEELVSDALFSLIRAVDRFRIKGEVKPENLARYINRTIWLDLKKAVLKNQLIPIPSTVLHRKLKDGTLQHADVVSLLGNEDIYRDGDQSDVDVDDFINVVIKSDESKRILSMRVAKYEDHQIANELKVKVSYVWNRCREVRQSLNIHLSS